MWCLYKACLRQSKNVAHLEAETSSVKLGNAALQARVPTMGTCGERVTNLPTWFL